MITIDPELFDPAAIPADIVLFNRKLLETINATPDPWSLDHTLVRKARKEGKGVFPFEPPHPEGRTLEIDGPHGKLKIRHIPPSSTKGNKPRGSFLHLHGGGWMYGDHELQDQRLKQMADATGLNMLSLGYRLAPEAPWPAANEDCEYAAQWLVENRDHGFETGFLAIGGDSAGGHLTATTLLRLRDKTGTMPFQAAVFIAGCFDLRLSASARLFGTDRLILNTRDIQKYVERYLGGGAGADRSNPDISPILGELHLMPPAHFSVGTSDPLLDDSLLMALRWSQSEADTELDIYPGGCHVFQYFDNSQSRRSHQAIAGFLNRQIDKSIARTSSKP